MEHLNGKDILGKKELKYYKNLVMKEEGLSDGSFISFETGKPKEKPFNEDIQFISSLVSESPSNKVGALLTCLSMTVAIFFGKDRNAIFDPHGRSGKGAYLVSFEGTTKERDLERFLSNKLFYIDPSLLKGGMLGESASFYLSYFLLKGENKLSVKSVKVANKEKTSKENIVEVDVQLLAQSVKVTQEKMDMVLEKFDRCRKSFQERSNKQAEDICRIESALKEKQAKEAELEEMKRTIERVSVKCPNTKCDKHFVWMKSTDLTNWKCNKCQQKFCFNCRKTLEGTEKHKCNGEEEFYPGISLTCCTKCSRLYKTKKGCKYCK